jgi:drug/metabolite transporter (DMT)-like permease
MIGEAAALGSAALWASSTVAIKDVTGRLSAFYIMAVRTGIAAVLAVVILLAVRPNDPTHGMALSTFAVLLASGLIAILGDATFIRAIAIEDVSRVFTISTSLYILLSVVGSFFFAGGTVSWLLPLGGLAVLIGSRLVLYESVPAGGAVQRTALATHARLDALWLSVVAAVLWTVSLLIVSAAMKGVDPLSATVLRLPFMAAAMVLLVFVRGDHRRHGWPGSDLPSLGLSGAMVLGSILLFLVSAKLSGAGTVAVLTSTSPIFAVPFAYFFLKEKITLRVAGGTAACMLGVCLTLL